MNLQTIAPAPGDRKAPKRRGRGPGSKLGKTSGRGQKGRLARKHGKNGFEGGQTPVWKRFPKRGFYPFSKRPLKSVNMGKILDWVELGRIDPSKPITLKVLRDSGCVHKFRFGIKVLAGGGDQVAIPIHLEVSDASEEAKRLVKEAGGSVKMIWYNRLGLRAHLKPHKFDLLPRTTGTPPPRYRKKYPKHNPDDPQAGEYYQEC